MVRHILLKIPRHIPLNLTDEHPLSVSVLRRVPLLALCRPGSPSRPSAGLAGGWMADYRSRAAGAVVSSARTRWRYSASQWVALRKRPSIARISHSTGEVGTCPRMPGDAAGRPTLTHGFGSQRDRAPAASSGAVTSSARPSMPAPTRSVASKHGTVRRAVGVSLSSASKQRGARPPRPARGMDSVLPPGSRRVWHLLYHSQFQEDHHRAPPRQGKGLSGTACRWVVREV